jgi:hypothetical protein
MDTLALAPAARQVTGYALAWNSMFPAERIAEGGVVQLRSDGTYRYHPVSLAEHESVFLAAVTVYHARRD